ncbi:M15 family metallopeptidase [Cellulomonas sp. P5_C5]
MFSSTHARRPRSAVVSGAVGVAIMAVAVVGFLGDQPSSASVVLAASEAPAPPPRDAAPVLGADGSVPDGVTVFDDEVPAVANLDPDLLDAFRRAATDAAADGITFVVNSGWRSAEYQDQLLRDAVIGYGSAAEAARWVATPDTSPHVQGAAVDVGPWAAATWLSEHGAGYGLCQVYGNEPWHYELRPEAVDGGCPTLYADPTHDPRMHP